MRTITIMIGENLLYDIDSVIAYGYFSSRSDVVKEALRKLFKKHHRFEGYLNELKEIPTVKLTEDEWVARRCERCSNV